MLDTNDYELLKESFIASQRLFTKLRVVIENANNIEYDESGFYFDEEKMYARHKAKLSSKIFDELCLALDTYIIEIVSSDDISLRELTFNLNKNNSVSTIKVDFSQEDSLNIIQLS